MSRNTVININTYMDSAIGYIYTELKHGMG